MSLTRWSTTKWIISGAGLLLAALIFSRILAPAYDFQGVYYPAIRDFETGHFAYSTSPGYLNPPWALLLMMPLGWFGPEIGHGLLVAVTLLVMYETMRDYRRKKLSYPLAVISLPMLAVVWLGQLEVFSLMGALIGYRAATRRQPWWMAVALLLLLIKPQETWVIILFLLVGSVRQWTKLDWVKIGVPVILVIGVTSLWLGAGWITRLAGAPVEYAGQWQNFSIWRWDETLPRGLVVCVWGTIAIATVWLLRRVGLTRPGLAVAAVSSALLSPYLTAPHLLMVVCLSWGLLLDRSLVWGVAAYIVSLTPLLRIFTGNQALNRLDVIFPLVVFAGWCALVAQWPRQERLNVI